ncbi:MAG: FadR/GntR family transcriptional regulator [Evtepia sp.]
MSWTCHGQLGVSRATLREATAGPGCPRACWRCAGAEAPLSPHEAGPGRGLRLFQTWTRCAANCGTSSSCGPSSSRPPPAWPASGPPRRNWKRSSHRGEAVDRAASAGNQDRTAADREFHAAIVRATHNSFMMRLLPMINRAVAAAIVSGQHKDQLAEDTRRDHALLMDFFRKRDADGAAHAMAIHMHHSIDVMGLEE